MPTVRFTDEELQALKDAYRVSEQVNWTAYDRARVRILEHGERHLQLVQPQIQEEELN